MCSNIIKKLSLKAHNPTRKSAAEDLKLEKKFLEKKNKIDASKLFAVEDKDQVITQSGS